MRSSTAAAYFWRCAILFPYVLAQDSAKVFSTVPTISDASTLATISASSTPTAIASTVSPVSISLSSNVASSSSGTVAVSSSSSLVSISSSLASISLSSASGSAVQSSSITSPSGSTVSTAVSGATTFAPGASEPQSIPPIVPNSFSPFPVPSDLPLPPVFPSVDPSNPPDVSVCFYLDPFSNRGGSDIIFPATHVISVYVGDTKWESYTRFWTRVESGLCKGKGKGEQ